MPEAPRASHHVTRILRVESAMKLEQKREDIARKATGERTNYEETCVVERKASAKQPFALQPPAYPPPFSGDDSLSGFPRHPSFLNFLLASSPIRPRIPFLQWCGGSHLPSFLAHLWSSSLFRGSARAVGRPPVILLSVFHEGCCDVGRSSLDLLRPALAGIGDARSSSTCLDFTPPVSVDLCWCCDGFPSCASVLTSSRRTDHRARRSSIHFVFVYADFDAGRWSYAVTKLNREHKLVLWDVAEEGEEEGK
ncbi:hypothetical protein MRX96_002703 [Rhipicephalus microplus]